LDNLKEVENNANYTFVKGDICDYDLLDKIVKENKIDLIVHFAAESHVDNSIKNSKEFIKTNIEGTHTLLEVAKNNNNIRFHHISTDEVFGHLSLHDNPFNEKTPYAPRSPYSASKASSDHLVRAYYHTYNLPITISNCSNNYGPNQFPEKLLPLFINNIRNGKSLPVYGDGKFTRDWLYVVDHAIAIDKIYHEGRNAETYNIGGFNEWTNLDLIHLLCKQMDEKLGRDKGSSAKLITYVKDRAGHDRRYAIDANKLNKELGWKPTVTFEEGLAKTLDWYLENEKWLDNVTSGSYQDYYKKMYG